MARVLLLNVDDAPAEHRAFMQALADNGSLINLYRALAHSPVVMQHFIGMLSALWDGALSPREREIAILIAVRGAQYPLGWHLGDAKKAGLSDAEIDDIMWGDPIGNLPGGEAKVAEFAEELTNETSPDEATVKRLTTELSERKIVELTVLVGLYRLVADITNTLDVDLDEEPARTLVEWGLRSEDH